MADALYWSPAQQIAHATSNGASLRTGDVFASGTLSGPDPRTEGGSFIELTARGAQPLDLPNGETRGFLEDGDRVVLRGWCGSGSTRVGFGELDGTVVVGADARRRLTMPYYRHVGDVPRKRHSYVPADGGYLFEELMGHEGFAQESSLLYHLRLAERDRRRRGRGRGTGVDHARPSAAAAPPPHRRDDPCRATPIGDRTVLFANDDVRIAWFAATADSDLYRDATGDQLVYVQSGTGTLESSFGALTVGPGDYVVDPDRRRRTAGASGTRGAADRARARIVPATCASRASTSPIAGSSARARRSPSATCAAPKARSSATDRDVPVLVRSRARAVAPRARDASVRRRRRGTAACGRSRSRSTTSSRSSAPGTSRRRCTRRSRATGSSSARSCRARSTSAKAR